MTNNSGLIAIESDYFYNSTNRIEHLFKKVLNNDLEAIKFLNRISLGVLTGYIDLDLDEPLSEQFNHIDDSLISYSSLSDKKLYLIALLVQLYKQNEQLLTKSQSNFKIFEEFLLLNHSFEHSEWRSKWLTDTRKHPLNEWQLSIDNVYLARKKVSSNLNSAIEDDACFQILNICFECADFISRWFNFLSSVSSPLLRSCFSHYYKFELHEAISSIPFRNIFYTAIKVLQNIPTSEKEKITTIRREIISYIPEHEMYDKLLADWLSKFDYICDGITSSSNEIAVRAFINEGGDEVLVSLGDNYLVDDPKIDVPRLTQLINNKI